MAKLIEISCKYSLWARKIPESIISRPYSFGKGGKKIPDFSKDPCAPKKTKNSCKSKSAIPNPPVCPPPKSPICPPPKPPCPCPCCAPTPTFSPAIAGKVAIITGASVGIGFHIARAILKNGGKVMLGDVKEDEGKEAICKIIEEFGMNKAAFIRCDVTKANDMECLFNAALCEFKQIDIVVNNAGILEDQKWDKTIDINVKGVIRGTLMGFHYMRKNKCGGRIINLSSILGHEPCYPCPVYCGTKHFVIGFSRSMGSDFYFYQSGVKVMTLCPGVTLSAMIVDSGSRPQLEGFGDTAKAVHDELYRMPTQPVEACGMHVVPILEADINGSDWISENNEVYRVNRVDRRTLRIPG